LSFGIFEAPYFEAHMSVRNALIDTDLTFAQAIEGAIVAARGGDPLGGLRQARAAYARVARSSNVGDKIIGLNCLALCQASHSAYIEAIATAMDAFALAQGEGDELQQAHALTTLAGAANFVLDTIDASHNMLDRCIGIAQAHGDIALEVRGRSIRGVVLGNLMRFDEAEIDFEWATAHIAQAGAMTPLLLVQGNWAQLYLKRAKNAHGDAQQAHWALAETRILNAISATEATGDVEAQSRLHSSIGDLRRQQGRITEAIDAYSRSQVLGFKTRNTGRIVGSQMDIGHIALANGQFGQAISQFDAAYVLADSIRPSSQLAAACRGAVQAWGLDDSVAAEVRAAKIHHYQTLAAVEDEKFNQARKHTKKALEAFCIAQALRAAA
jgi:tetratricopeptide (TPR) repeat protein